MDGTRMTRMLRNADLRGIAYNY